MMLGSEVFIGYIDYFKTLRHNHRMQSLNRRDRETIQLEDILYELDFGYDIINGKLKLADFLRANRGNVENVQFEINENLAQAVLGSLDDCLIDYILIPIVKDLISSMGVRPTYLQRAKDVLKYMLEYSDLFTDKQFLMVKAIINPTIVQIDNVINNTKRSN